MSISHDATLSEQALAALRRNGNPFRQQFARNSDDAVCSLYHVDDLFAKERSLLQSMIETYRGEPKRPTAVLPLLGPRGAGKTHLLHCLKHGPGVAAQLFVTPGTFRVDANGQESSFLEYFLYQLINVLLAGGEQRGIRPIQYVGEQITRRTLREAIDGFDDRERHELASGPAGGLLGWLKRRNHPVGNSLDQLKQQLADPSVSCAAAVVAAELDPSRLAAAVDLFLDRHESRDLKGEFRKRIAGGFVRAILTRDETGLADFLTDGFTEVPFVVRPSRAQLTMSLLQALTEMIVGVGIPIAIAFDQLEELLYGQSDDEIRRSSDAFFGGIVQLMSQMPGLAVLLFVEEGLWNRIVPPLPSHILDRIHEPIHLPNHGTVRSVRLSAPSPRQLADVVACRVSRTLADLPGADQLPAGFPFPAEFLAGLAKKETVLRLMLQGCCNKLDEMLGNKVVEPGMPAGVRPRPISPLGAPPGVRPGHGLGGVPRVPLGPRPVPGAAIRANLTSTVNTTGAASAPAAETPPPLPAETPATETHASDDTPPEPTPPRASGWEDLIERWHQEVRVSERKLKPVGSLAAATGELQGGMARWLQVCKALGVEQGDWHMTDVREQLQVGDHPTYGSVTAVEWSDSSGRKQMVGVGLWLGRGVGKPRDLDTKLEVFLKKPCPIDYLILMRPADDARLSGKTQAAFDQAIAANHGVRIEAVDQDVFAKMHAFPRWMQQVSDLYGGGRVPEQVFVFLAEQTESIMLRLGLPTEVPVLPAAAG